MAVYLYIVSQSEYMSGSVATHFVDRKHQAGPIFSVCSCIMYFITTANVS